MKRLVLLFAFFAFSCGQLAAQSVPALINYQGQLTDANGTNLPTADYILTFNIYDLASGGLLVWGPQVFDGTSTQGHGPKIPVVQGYFNVLLGSNDTAGRSLAEAFNGAARYVEIKLGTNGPIRPRQQILSAPFALKAASAEKLTVPGASTLAVSVAGNGHVGIGKPDPQVALDVLGSVSYSGLLGKLDTAENPAAVVRSSNFYLGSASRRGVPGRALVDDGASLIINYDGDWATTEIDGNVGIGVPNPDRALVVSGKAYVGGPIYNPATPGYFDATFTVEGTTDASGGTVMYLLGPWPNAWMTDRSFLQCFSYPGEIRAYIRGDGAYFNTSSRSEKTNITSLGNSLGTLGKIQGVSYDWKGDQFSKKQNLGFIAEDLAEALPQAVSADGKMVNYSAVIPVLVEGVKEMHQIVKAQETALAAKDRQIESLGQRLAALEKTVQALASQQPGGNR